MRELRSRTVQALMRSVLVRPCGVCRDPLARAASDHFPLWLDLEPLGPSARRQPPGVSRAPRGQVQQ